MDDEVKSGPLVVRSSPPPARHYREYFEPLRYDFFHMCAYCTFSEVEAQTVSFSIDHYEPVSAEPSLENAYENLMYSCTSCNTLKGDRTPPPSARADGVRFYRPDNDIFGEHFVLKGVLIKGLTKAGEYTIEGIDLNRAMLRRLRDIRRRKIDADSYVAEGLAALRRIPIDQMPAALRGKALTAINGITKDVDLTASKIDEFIRAGARSEIADAMAENEDATHASERKNRLKEFEKTYGCSWRGRNRRR